MREWTTSLQKLVSLSGRDRRRLAAAQVALLRAQWVVWTRPQGRLVCLDDRPADAIDRSAIVDARDLARGVFIVAQRGLFRPSCLVRSIALVRLLERAGIAGSRLRVGVRDNAGRFEAHAWVELGGVVLADSASHVIAFEELASVRPLGVR
jgi:hypothetical protein